VVESVFGRASGVGSWPGDDVLEAARTVIGELPDPSVPHLAELPARGPGSDLVGRGAVFLVDTPVDLQPSGWRLVSRPGRDLERAQSMLRQDLDVLAELADGYQGPLKLQVAGPWTLAASLHLPRLERAVVDAGARRDIVAALAEGVALHVGEVRRLVPGAEVVVQVDEPSVVAVLEGRLATASGFGRLRAVDESVVVDGVNDVLAAARKAGAVHTIVHSCGGDVPVDVLLRCRPDGLSVDVSLLGAPGWEALAPAMESGTWLWAGVVPTTGAAPGAGAVADAVWRPWRRLGLDPGLLDQVVVTPTCGLARSAPGAARAALAAALTGARELAGRAQG
jgi:methionine synthase II (cobalamin-independent)